MSRRSYATADGEIRHVDIADGVEWVPGDEDFASALHGLYAAALCVSDLGPHTFEECDTKSQWLGDAAGFAFRLGVIS